MHFIYIQLSRGKTEENPELCGVCPNMSYPVEIFFPKREISFTFSKINCPIGCRSLPRQCIWLQGLLVKKYGWTGKKAWQIFLGILKIFGYSMAFLLH